MSSADSEKNLLVLADRPQRGIYESELPDADSVCLLRADRTRVADFCGYTVHCMHVCRCQRVERTHVRYVQLVEIVNPHMPTLQRAEMEHVTR